MALTTAQWKKAGLPFEGWLRYSQLTKAQQEAVELEIKLHTAARKILSQRLVHNPIA